MNSTFHYRRSLETISKFWRLASGLWPQLFPSLGHTLCPNSVAIPLTLADNLAMVQKSSDLKAFLQEELANRCRRNPAYSLRSFAKALDLSPSFLSKILNGQRRITDQVFTKLTNKLNLDPEVVSSLGSEDGFNPLQLEYFKVISDWYHYAILELTHLRGFKESPRWIANKLGITESEAQRALERLIQLGLLQKRMGRLRPTTGGNTTTKNHFTDLAFKKMQDDLLRKAIDSLWNEKLDLRDHTSICMAIDPKDIPEVKRRLKQMRREICQFLERPKSKKPTEVYNLSLSFFSLTKESV